MLFEAFLEDGGLILGEAELLPGVLGVLFVADSAGETVVIFALAALAAEAGDGAVWGGDSAFLLLRRLRQTVHVDSLQKRSRLLTSPICMYQ